MLNLLNLQGIQENIFVFKYLVQISISQILNENDKYKKVKIIPHFKTLLYFIYIYEELFEDNLTNNYHSYLKEII